MAATAWFMTHVTCRLTVKNRDQLRNPVLGNRVWATFLSYFARCMTANSGENFEHWNISSARRDVREH